MDSLVATLWPELVTGYGPPSPPYSANLVLSDIPLFGLLKKNLTADSDLQQTPTWSKLSSDAYFFCAGIQALIPRWDKFLNVIGAYV
jgi:hypothetical protein